MNRKKAKWLTRTIIGMAIFLLIGVVIIALGKKKIDEYAAQQEELIMEIENNRQVVYVVKDDKQIKKGDLLLAEGEDANVMKQEIYSGLEAEYYITDEDIGSIAIVDMEPSTPIMKNMVTTMLIAHDTREVEVNVVDLMIDQKINDYIDIRIMYPNGEDYLVLPKKQVKNLVLDSATFYTYLNEEEILRLASATVDAYMMTGTKIYATRYVESNIQKEATPDYLVSAQVIDLIVSDPNIVSLAQETMNLAARMSLEQRLKGLTKEQLDAVAEGHGLVDTAKTSILTTGATFALDENEQENDSTQDEESMFHETLPETATSGIADTVNGGNDTVSESINNGLDTLNLDLTGTKQE